MDAGSCNESFCGRQSLEVAEIERDPVANVLMGFQGVKRRLPYGIPVVCGKPNNRGH